MIQKTALHNCIFSLGIISIICLTFLLQHFYALGGDSCFLVSVTKKLLLGENYASNFFEADPPAILYLFVPPVMLSHYFAADIFLTMQIYIVLWSLFSLILCYPITQQIFPNNKKSQQFFLLAILFSFLFLPLDNFAEREHFFFILTIPYFVLMIGRFYDYQPALILSLIIGIIAGWGFCIKPHFFIPFAFIECAYIFHQKRFTAWLRPEVFSIAAILMLNIFLILVVYPNYIYFILPLLLKYYYQSNHYSAWDVIMNPLAIFCYFSVLFAMLSNYNNQFAKLNYVLLVVLIGFLICYFAQVSYFYYHLYPALCIALILLVTGISFWTPAKLRSISCWQWGGGCGLFLAYIYFLQGTAWVVWRVFPELLLVFIFFALLVLFYNTYKYKTNNGLFTLMAMVLLSMPVFWVGIEAKSSFLKLNFIKPLIAFMENHTQGKSVYFLTRQTNTPLVATFASHSLAVSSFPNYVHLTAVIEKLQNNPNDIVVKKDRDIFTHMLIRDLLHEKPDFVFIDRQDQRYAASNIAIDYLHYFSYDPVFLNIWQKQYQYVATISTKLNFANLNLYHYDVYQRKH